MAFHKPASGDIVQHTDITQIIEALDGTYPGGEAIKLTAVDSATEYALSIKNRDTVSGLGLRILDPNDAVVMQTNKNAVAFGKNVTITDSLTIDGVDIDLHDHSGATGMGEQLAEGGLADGAVTTAKLGTGAVTAAKIASATITADQIANSTITAAKLSFDPATQDEFDAHDDATSAVHGLPSGAYVLGTKAGAARWIEVKSASTTTNEATMTLTVVWDHAFATAIEAAVSSFGRTGDGNRYITTIEELSISSTGASHEFALSGSTKSTLSEYWIAIGY